MIKIRIKSKSKTLIINFNGDIEEAVSFMSNKLTPFVGDGEVVPVIIYDHRERGRRKQHLINFRGLTADKLIKKLC